MCNQINTMLHTLPKMPPQGHSCRCGRFWKLGKTKLAFTQLPTMGPQPRPHRLQGYGERPPSSGLFSHYNGEAYPSVPTGEKGFSWSL